MSSLLNKKIALAILSEQASDDIIPYVKADSPQEARERISIYRNNYYSSLLDLLCDKYPIALKVVGEDFFRFVAKKYIQAHPLDNPVLFGYGDTFSDFIQPIASEHNLFYLSDLVRLEAAQNKAYYSEDIIAITAEKFAQYDISALSEATLTLTPSTTLIQSSYAVYAIWEMLNGEESVEVQSETAENVWVFRKGFTISTIQITDAMSVFLNALIMCKSLGVALEEAMQSDSELFNPAEAIHFLIINELISQIESKV